MSISIIISTFLGVLFVYILLILIYVIAAWASRKIPDYLGKKSGENNWEENFIAKILRYSIFLSVQFVTTVNIFITWVGKTLLRKHLLSIFSFIILFLILWFYPLGLTPFSRVHQSEKLIILSIFSNIFTWLGFSSIDDTVTKNAISMVVTLIASLLAVTLAFYVFIHREQKNASVSSSYNISRNLSLIYFIVCGVSTYLYGKLLVAIIEKNMSLIKDKLSCTLINSPRILWFYILFSLTIYFAIRMVYQLLRNTNVRWVLNYTIIETRTMFFEISLTQGKKLRGTIYENIFNNIECVYQLLSHTIEKNQDEVYSVNFSEWQKAIGRLYTARLPIFDINPLYFSLIEKDEDDYCKLYRLILKNHLSLIMNLYKNHKLEEVENSLTLFFELGPRDTDPIVKKLNEIYLSSLHELLILIYDKDLGALKILLGEVTKRSKKISGDELNNIASIYQDLVLRTVIKDDVRLLTTIVYSISKSIETKEYQELNIQPDFRKDFVGEMFKAFEEQTLKEIKVNEPSDFELGCLFILLQGALKSIELANYNTTGFLVKFLVTGFESRAFNKVFDDFNEHTAMHNFYLHKVGNLFNFNDKTLIYCLQKLTLLIFCQQKYVVQNYIDFGKVPTSYIQLSILNCFYLDYIFEKLSKAKGKYGLICLEDSKFMCQIKIEVIKLSGFKILKGDQNRVLVKCDNQDRIVLPEVIMSKLNIVENQPLEIKITNNEIHIEKIEVNC